jgi:hypothetical protein
MAEQKFDEAVFIAALGRAVVKTWPTLAPEIQHQIFEAAAEFGAGELLPDEVARFLHDHHPRTAKSS